MAHIYFSISAATYKEEEEEEPYNVLTALQVR